MGNRCKHCNSCDTVPAWMRTEADEFRRLLPGRSDKDPYCNHCWNLLLAVAKEVRGE